MGEIYQVFAIVFWVGFVLLLFPSIRDRAKSLLLFPQSGHQSHLSSLDAFRGLAALFVAVFHTWQWTQPAFDEVTDYAQFITQGDKAVPVFVVLSGLLIYRSLMRVETIDHLREYFKRRFLRIFPVYFATVLFASLVLTHHWWEVAPFQYVLSEVFMLRVLQFPLLSNLPAWSLHIEVLFYCLIPIFVLVTQRRLFWACVAFFVFCLGDAMGPRELGLWKYFCIGVIAAEIIEKWKMRPDMASLVGILGIFVIVLDFASFDWAAHLLMSTGLQITGGHKSYTISLGIGALLLIVGAVQSPLLRPVFENFPLRMLGAISYSVFMWHSFLIVLNFPITFGGKANLVKTGVMPTMGIWEMVYIVIPGIIAFSTLSYLLIERPFLVRRPVPSPTSAIPLVG